MIQKKHETPTSPRKENEPSISLAGKDLLEQTSAKAKEINANTEQNEEKMEQSWELQKKRHRKNHLHL